MKLIPYCFRKEDVIDNFSNKFQFDNWLKTKVKNKNIKKVKNGLYVTIDSMGNIHSSKFEIASKISKDSFVAFHSALEYYGIANQVSTDMIVCSTSRFNAFEFDNIEYKSKQTNNYEQVNYISNEKVCVSSLERTIVDCIHNINLAGGIEEVLNALDQIKILDEMKLSKVLRSYNQVFLYQKTGFILEQYKDQLMLSDGFFIEFQNHLTNQIKYFLKDEYKDIKLNKKWKLIAPVNIKSRINGGLS